MTVLRVYDPVECDPAGVPLDWERCRACEGSGRYSGVPRWYGAVCPICDGHGSLKAAALIEAGASRLGINSSLQSNDPDHPIRCEGCGHPMSEGTWGPILPTPEMLADWGWGNLDEWAQPHLVVAQQILARGREPFDGAATYGPMPVHYSRCDEGCRHGGPGRWRMIGNLVGPGGEYKVWKAGVDLVPHYGVVVEASWRPVDVRTLGWPHDLRSEKLAVLCLRCLVERTR